MLHFGGLVIRLILQPNMLVLGRRCRGLMLPRIGLRVVLLRRGLRVVLLRRWMRVVLEGRLRLGARRNVMSPIIAQLLWLTLEMGMLIFPRSRLWFVL